jgi:uncharacterized protein (DUF302 family)
MGKSKAVFDSKINKRASGSIHKIKLPIAFILVGLFIGTGLIMVSGFQSAHRKIITVHQSKYHDVDQTCECLKSALEKNSFNCKGILDLNKSMAHHGVQLSRQARVIQFGQSGYAHDIAMANPELSVLMPCAFSVYEDDGIVYISSLNRDLIGQMFGGTTEKIMSEHVAPDKMKVLSDCIEHKHLDIQTKTTDAF